MSTVNFLKQAYKKIFNKSQKLIKQSAYVKRANYVLQNKFDSNLKNFSQAIKSSKNIKVAGKIAINNYLDQMLLDMFCIADVDGLKFQEAKGKNIGKIRHC